MAGSTNNMGQVALSLDGLSVVQSSPVRTCYEQWWNTHSIFIQLRKSGLWNTRKEERIRNEMVAPCSLDICPRANVLHNTGIFTAYVVYETTTLYL